MAAACQAITDEVLCGANAENMCAFDMAGMTCGTTAVAEAADNNNNQGTGGDN